MLFVGTLVFLGEQVRDGSDNKFCVPVQTFTSRTIIVLCIVVGNTQRGERIEIRIRIFYKIADSVLAASIDQQEHAFK